MYRRLCIRMYRVYVCALRNIYFLLEMYRGPKRGTGPSSTAARVVIGQPVPCAEFVSPKEPRQHRAEALRNCCTDRRVCLVMGGRQVGGTGRRREDSRKSLLRKTTKNPYASAHVETVHVSQVTRWHAQVGAALVQGQITHSVLQSSDGTRHSLLNQHCGGPPIKIGCLLMHIQLAF